MKFRKVTVEKAEVGALYVAYSAKNKTLSSNGDRGVLVKIVEKTKTGVKVKRLGMDSVTAITGLDTRDNAWLYSPLGADIKVRVLRSDKEAWPKFSQRMEQEGWEGKDFIFKEEELYLIDDEGHAHQGVTLLRHEGDTTNADGDKYINNFLASDVYPVEPPEWRIPKAQRMGIGAVVLPLPPKPVAEEHKEVIEKLTPLFKDLHEGNISNVSCAKIKGDSLEDVKEYLGRACHAGLHEDGTWSKETRYIATIGNSHSRSDWNRGNPCKEALLLWITYLANYSPYSDAIITKDPEYILKHGYIIDASYPVRIVVGACYATRQVWEKKSRCEGFYELYKAGVPLHQAFVFGSQCSESDRGVMKFARSDNDHSHLANGKLSDECIINFIKGTPSRAGKSYSQAPSSAGDGAGVNGMWSWDYSTNPSPMFKKLMGIKKRGGWDSGALPTDEAVELAADYIEEWSAKHGV